MNSSFTTRPGTRLAVETIRHAILSDGFTPTWLGFTVQADLTAHEGRAALRVPDTGQLIWLVENPRLDALRKALKGRTARAVITALIPEGEREGAAITSFSLADM